MILSLFRKKASDSAVHEVYGAIVARSRQPVFYARWSVPDTVTGRFDMISVHLALLFRRLRDQPDETRQFSQAVFDLFFKDMDRSLREMGAGDLAVPKKIQKMGGLFYGTLASLDQALSSEDDTVAAEVLKRNIYGDVPGADPLPLARYVRAQARRLAAQPIGDIMAGRLPEGDAE